MGNEQAKIDQLMQRRSTLQEKKSKQPKVKTIEQEFDEAAGPILIKLNARQKVEEQFFRDALEQFIRPVAEDKTDKVIKNLVNLTPNEQRPFLNSYRLFKLVIKRMIENIVEVEMKAMKAEA